MRQLFPPASNTIARVSLTLGLLLPAVALLAGSAISRAPYNTKVDIPLDQPVPFSHEHHVNELGLDCQYCHTSVEKGPKAGLPPTHTCMGCHSQIWTNSPLLEPVRKSFQTGEPIKWNLVNSVPDFVYFDHSIHVKKGIGCTECHGPVHEMQITYKAKPFHMAWCLQCHRKPEEFIRPKEEVMNPHYSHPKNHVEVGRKLVDEYGIKVEQLTDCSICHR
ncbi:MAG: cytochrome C [Chthonomonadales bacterium]|nr:cytochrome C [Chthonomonadales bacterium]